MSGHLGIKFQPHKSERKYRLKNRAGHALEIKSVRRVVEDVMADKKGTDIFSDSFLGNPDNLRSILININDAIYMTDRERRIVFWNSLINTAITFSKID